jgi:hypothetical protein
MADDWGDIDTISKPKSQVPKLLFCGCGCLIPVLFLVTVLLWGMSTVNRGKDEELQLQELEDVLPYDKPPEGFKLQFGYQPGILSFLFDVEVYVFMEQAIPSELDAETDAAPDADAEVDADEPDEPDEADPDDETLEAVTTVERTHPPQRIWIFMRSEDEDLDDMIDTSNDEIASWSPPGSEAVETIRVQGLDLPVAVVRGSEVQMPWGAPSGGSGDGDTALAIRISPEGADQIMILLIVGEDAEGVTPEQITRFLEPFHVGPER